MVNEYSSVNRRTLGYKNRLIPLAESSYCHVHDGKSLVSANSGANRLLSEHAKQKQHTSSKNDEDQTKKNKKTPINILTAL